MKICFTYQPPWRVNVNPKRESRSTDTRIPMIPNPCGVTTWPRITDTRLLHCWIILNPIRLSDNQIKTKKKTEKIKRNSMSISNGFIYGFFSVWLVVIFNFHCKNQIFTYLRKKYENKTIKQLRDSINLVSTLNSKCIYIIICIKGKKMTFLTNICILKISIIIQKEYFIVSIYYFFI